MWVHRFTVEGSGPFPLDMLRYDQVFPGSNQNFVSDSLSQENAAFRKVELVHYGIHKDWIPSLDRWKDFGWSVAYWEEAERVRASGR